MTPWNHSHYKSTSPKPGWLASASRIAYDTDAFGGFVEISSHKGAPIGSIPMLIGILSDTHDRLERAKVAVSRLSDEGAQFLVHCGDFTSPEIVYLCGVMPFACVLGNNDWDVGGIRTAVEALGGSYLEWGGEVTCGDKRIAITHGDNARAFRSLLASQPDYLCFGHTHEALNERDGPTRQINPGALHRARRYTVAMLDTERDDVRFLEIA